MTKDLDAQTMTVTSEFDAGPGRVWELWTDPRQLERWWGPPTYPATFVEHDLTAGGRATYFMTSPEGQKFHGWWRIEEAEAPNRLRFEGGFALYIVEVSDNSGGGLMTMLIDDLDERVAAIGSRGIEADEVEHYSEDVRKVVYRDADGNEVGFGSRPNRR